MDLSEVEDQALEYFKRQGFQIEEWPFLDPSIEWRPRARVSRERRGITSTAVIVARENFTSFKNPHNWGPLLESRRKIPSLAIYFVVPESLNQETLSSELKDIGIGLYVIKPEGNLERVFGDRVPFDDLIISYPIEPDKPYRNRQNVLKVLANCENYIWWLDKHFTEAGLDFLYDYLTTWSRRKPLTEISILGSNLVRPGKLLILRTRFLAFQREFINLGIRTEMRLLDPGILSSIHDRYVISTDIAFNVMPTDSLARGQMGSLTLEENPPDFQSYWRTATPL